METEDPKPDQPTPDPAQEDLAATHKYARDKIDEVVLGLQRIADKRGRESASKAFFEYFNDQMAKIATVDMTVDKEVKAALEGIVGETL